MWCVVFFFKQKTAYEMRISDWSSDVCSSDLLLEVFGAVVVAEEALRIAGEPGIAALLLEGIGDALDHLGIAQRLAGLFVDEDRQRHAPQALARNAPVRPLLDHRAQAIAPGDRKSTRLNSSH